MLLRRVVETSAEVASTRSRLEKRRLLADVLREAAGDGSDELELATAYLSGRLPQRRTGVGWRGLTELPEPAAEATVRLGEVNEVMSRLERLSGSGSATSRRGVVRDLFSRLAVEEQEFVRALLTEGLRQGANDSVMLDAIAETAAVPVAAVRRAAMFSAPTGPVAAAALTGGVADLERFTLVAGRPVRPMLAASAADIAAAVTKAGGGPVAVDTKLDGIRIQAHRTGGEVRVFTRSLDEIGDRLPAVVAAIRALPGGDLVLDGEAMSLSSSGRPAAFQDTSSLTGRHGATNAVVPFFFDVLYAGGRPLIEAPLAERLAVLDAIVPEALRVTRIMHADAGAAERFYEAAVAEGQEGVIVKRLDAAYDAGRRGSAWVKVKPVHALDLVVLAVEWGSGRRRGKLSNIHLGARDPATGEAVMLGKTFKGMTDEMLAWQTERFTGLAISPSTMTDHYVVPLRPEQVVEIAFDGVQRSTRYAGGVALRFARVVRYRDDKSAAEADTIEAVRALAAE